MHKKMSLKSKRLERLLWSIALPGLGQLLNRQYLKGFLFIGLEFVVNILGNLNQAIVLSFHGQIEEAIYQIDYLWYLFYPCLYFFAMWDAYKDAGDENTSFSYLPFVSSAYVVTIGVVLSPSLKVFGHLIGPVWLPILSIPIGLLIGLFTRWILITFYTRKDAV